MGGRQKGRASLPEMGLQRAGGLEEARDQQAINDFGEAGDVEEARDPDGTEEATEITQFMGPTGLRLGSACGFFGCFRFTRHTSCYPYAS